MDAAQIHARLVERFAEAVLGFEQELIDPAIAVAAGRIREIAQYLRDDAALQMDFLRCLTGVDRRETLEVVYHLLSTVHLHTIVLKVQVAPDGARVDSVWDLWRTAEWYEREAFDLLGIGFTGHPDLRRIMMPDDWEGHPLRKDYVFSGEYHGITAERSDGLDAFGAPATDKKAAQARGAAAAAAPPSAEEPSATAATVSAEVAETTSPVEPPVAAEKTPRIDEPGESPSTGKASRLSPPTAFQPAMHTAKADPVEGYIQLNMGPHHPASHGVLNFLLFTDGEILSRVIPDVGYLHRGMEKLAESMPYASTMPYTDRIDYLASMFGNWGWALAAEKLLGIEVPPRAEFCRVIAGELNRIASHLIGTGSTSLDLGAFTPFVHWLRERETVNDIMEMICGARLTYNYMRIGGVARDISQQVVDKTRRWLDHFLGIIDEFDRLISFNEIFVKRLANVAVISPQDALSWGLVGPNLRASGVAWDLRRAEPYSVYPELQFDLVLGKGWRGQVGDAYDRFYCRIEEMRQSVGILRQAFDRMPEGEIRAELPRKIKPAANEVYSRVESARGEMGFYVVSDGTDKPYRARYRTGSFTSMSIIEHLSPGLMVADLVALIGSLDVIAPEVDR
ncbi:MAG: NADH-quinone oxidoreductase subunit D [Bradymonadales bacterium]|nr:NADH-quinone oxidoreductase subunit D [Bradymonadales bacterium]